MAEINVTNWAEFVTAVATNDAVVNCPEKAVWDMNDIAPTGISGNISLGCATINGNGTKIKNLHFLNGNFLKNRTVTINDIEILNFVCETRDASGYRALFSGASSNNALYLNRCIISGLGNQHMQRLHNQKTYLDRCSINIDFTNTSASFGIFPVDSAAYCRLKQNAQSFTAALWETIGTCSFCELDIYMPQATQIDVGGISGCKLIGGFGDATLRNADTARSFPSIFSTAAMPAALGGTYVIGVTADQMKDAAYLASIGFPIGVN